MKKFFYRITIVLIFLIIIIGIMGTNQISAANFSFNFVGQTEANKGETITLTISANGLTGRVNLSSSNASLSDSQKWVEKNSVSITATINNFPATITATPDELTDNDYNIVDISPITITVNEKEISKPQVVEEVQVQETTPPPTINYSQEIAEQSTTSSKSSQSTTSSTTGSQTAVENNDQQIEEVQIVEEDQATSSNNYLKNIIINHGDLTPNFDREITEYLVDKIVEDEIEISAETEDERAIISGTGTIALIDGENIINILVTAENLAVRNYSIRIVKETEKKESNLRLKNLEVKKISEDGLFYNLDIGFQKDILNYSINVENDISDLDIIPTVNEEGIIVEVKGEKNLMEGDNDVNIILTDLNDKSNITVYNLKVKKSKKPVIEVSNSPEEKMNYIPLILFNVLILIIIGTLTYKYKKEQKMKNRKLDKY